MPRVCKAKIKDDNLDVVECGKKPINGLCPQLSIHISRYMSGYCEHKWCEGSNPKTFSGKPAPTCRIWKVCACSCHSMFDMMFKASGLPREVINNSEYRAPVGEFSMPTPEERFAMHAASLAAAKHVAVVVESPMPEAVPATIQRSFGPTATGRAARGELESWVKRQCDIWIVEADQDICGPQLLSDRIGSDEGIKPPSVGAISAVFERWVKIGFAVIETHPKRFIKYTELGIKLGLEGCKDKAKRDSKMAKANEARRLR